MPETLRRASSRSSSSSSSVRVLKFANWMARNARHSLPGLAIRAAITARHARAVALTRGLGWGENGMP
jgi:hypothetical protein